MLLLGLAQAVQDGVQNLLVEQGQLWGTVLSPRGDSSRDVLRASPRAAGFPAHGSLSPNAPSPACPRLWQHLQALSHVPKPLQHCHPLSATKGHLRGPHSYLFLGEAVGQIHLGREEKQRGFPSRAWLEEEMVAGQGRAARMGWHHPQHVRVGCPKGCCDTPQPRDSMGGFTPKPH